MEPVEITKPRGPASVTPFHVADDWCPILYVAEAARMAERLVALPARSRSQSGQS